MSASDGEGDASVLEILDLSKHFGDREAVRGLSLQISRGEIVGLLGPNGAGKTTTIGMIAGVVAPSGGTIKLGGFDVASTRERIGLVPQRIALYPTLTARENLEFFGEIHGISRARLEERIESLLALAGLAPRQSESVANFSGGMKRRLNLVCALVHEPDFLLLDEPTVGVDPQSRERIYEAIEELSAKGLALLLTTHYLEEAERLCDRLAVMDEGRIVAEGTIDELILDYNEAPSVEIELEKAAGDRVRSELETHQAHVLGDRRYRVVGTSPEKWLPDLLTHLAAESNAVRDLKVHRPNLGDVFLRLTGKELRD
jgi:ABC-2 type transport system ATP-binding protein